MNAIPVPHRRGRDTKGSPLAGTFEDELVDLANDLSSQRTPSTRPFDWDRTSLLVSELDQLRSFGQGYAPAGVFDDAGRQRVGLHDGPIAIQDEHRLLDGIHHRIP